MRKAATLSLVICTLSLLAGCAGLGANGKDAFDENLTGTIANFGANSILGIVADKHAQVSGIPIDLLGAFAPTIKAEFVKAALNEGPAEKIHPLKALDPAVAANKNFRVMFGVHATVESDEVVTLKTVFTVDKFSKSDNKFEHIFSKTYTANLFVDKIAASGPGAADQIKSKVAEKYKGIAPQIVNDLLGLKIQL